MVEGKYLVFLRAVELHSLTAAARELGYTQSNVTHMIQMMEKECGFQLLVRNKSGVSLTENGKRLFSIIREIVALEKKLDETIGEINGMQTGTLRIGCFSSVSTQWMPDAICYFRENYPKVECKLLNGEYQEIIEWLEDGKIDCGFLTDAAVGNHIFLPLVRDEMMAVFPADGAERGKGCKLQELAEKPFIYPYKTHADDVARLLKTEKVQPNVQFVVKGDEAIIALIKKGLGVGILPRMYLDSIHDPVVTVCPLEPPQYRTIGLAFSRKYGKLPLTDVFVSWLKHWLIEQGKEPLFKTNR